MRIDKEVRNDLDECDKLYKRLETKEAKQAILKLKNAIIIMAHKTEEIF